VRVVVDTGVFSASLSRRRLARLESHVRLMAGHLWIAASAIHIGAPLLAADGVFENTPGLTLHQ